MADEGGEKTEMPTQKKLRDAREKGQVCTSKDVVSTALLIVLLAICAAVAKRVIDDVESLFDLIVNGYSQDFFHQQARVIHRTAWVILVNSFLFVGVAAIVGIAANLCQVGFLFTFEPLKPDLNKINPASGAKRIFSVKNLFEFAKNVVKVTFLGYLIYKLILVSIPSLLTLCYGTLDDVMEVLGVILKRLAGYTIFGYVIIAVVDRLFQQKNFTKEMMMTKDEVKREYKEMEGSGEVKQAQRQFRDEIMNGPDPREVTKQSSVVVTNPTHLAIGIRYNLEEAPLPRIVVKGADHEAKIIRETARDAGIPVMENVPLARGLWEHAKVDDFIPPEFIEPVAEVLKWVKKLEAERREQEELDSVNL